MEYFILDGIKSSKFNAYVVNNGDAYTLSQYIPKPIHTYDISSRYITQDKSYYAERLIPLRIYIKTNKGVQMAREFGSWLSPTKTHTLSLSREPYKQYYVRLNSEYSPSIYPNCIVVDLEFIALDYLAYSTFKTTELDDVIFDDLEFSGSGIKKGTKYKFDKIGGGDIISVYHGGNADNAKPIIRIKGGFNELWISNLTTNQTCRLYYHLQEFEELVVDTAKQAVYISGVYNVSGHYGDFIELKGRTCLMDTLIDDEFDNGVNKIQIYSPNSMDIKEIEFEFRYVYY